MKFVNFMTFAFFHDPQETCPNPKSSIEEILKRKAGRTAFSRDYRPDFPGTGIHISMRKSLAIQNKGENNR